jgi:hypothetical protein
MVIFVPRHCCAVPHAAMLAGDADQEFSALQLKEPPLGTNLPEGTPQKA